MKGSPLVTTYYKFIHPMPFEQRRWRFLCECGNEWMAKAYNERCPVCRKGLGSRERLPITHNPTRT